MAYGYNPYETNDRGDSFNGRVGSQQAASVQNRSAQPSQSRPVSRGGNPYAEAVAGAARPALPPSGVGRGISPAQPRPQQGPQWNQTIERMLGGQPDFLGRMGNLYQQMQGGGPGEGGPNFTDYGRGGGGLESANARGYIGPAPQGDAPPPPGPPGPQGENGAPRNVPPPIDNGNDYGVVEVPWGPDDPSYDPNNFEHVARYYQRFNPAVTAADVQNYREWAYDPNAPEYERARRQAIHFNDWWKEKPLKTPPPDPNAPPPGDRPGYTTVRNTNPGGARGTDGSVSSGSATGSTTPGTGTAPGDSSDYLARLEASIRNRFQKTRADNLDQFRHQGGVNNLARYGASPEMLGEMYQAMAMDENTALMNPMLTTAENEQNRVLQKYGIDVGAETSKYAANMQASAAQSAAAASERAARYGIDWQRERFGADDAFRNRELDVNRDLGWGRIDQGTMDAYLDYLKFIQGGMFDYLDAGYRNSSDRFLD